MKVEQSVAERVVRLVSTMVGLWESYPGAVSLWDYSMFSQKWVFDKMGFSRILEISRRVLDFSKMGFRRNGFFFWASRLNTQKWFIFTRDFLAIFPNLCFLWKCCSKIGFSQEFSTRAQILKNGFSKKWFFLSAFWERKLEKWLTIFERTYCRAQEKVPPRPLQL